MSLGADVPVSPKPRGGGALDVMDLASKPSYGSNGSSLESPVPARRSRRSRSKSMGHGSATSSGESDPDDAPPEAPQHRPTITKSPAPADNMRSQFRRTKSAGRLAAAQQAVENMKIPQGLMASLTKSPFAKSKTINKSGLPGAPDMDDDEDAPSRGIRRCKSAGKLKSLNRTFSSDSTDSAGALHAMRAAQAGRLLPRSGSNRSMDHHEDELDSMLKGGKEWIREDPLQAMRRTPSKGRLMDGGHHSSGSKGKKKERVRAGSADGIMKGDGVMKGGDGEKVRIAVRKKKVVRKKKP